MEKNYNLKLSELSLKEKAMYSKSFLRLITLFLLLSFTTNVAAISVDFDTVVAVNLESFPSITSKNDEVLNPFIIKYENITIKSAMESQSLDINTITFIYVAVNTLDFIIIATDIGGVAIGKCASQKKESIKNVVDTALIKYTK